MYIKYICFLLGTLFYTISTFGQTDIYDSGGQLLPQQAAYDVTYYDLSLIISPGNKKITGSLSMTCTVKDPLDAIVLHLDTLLDVSKIVTSHRGDHSLVWERKSGLLYSHLNQPVQNGEIVTTTVYYTGHPLYVPDLRGTWSDGFFWEKTASGDPWIGNVSVLNGADIWWPCKDHPSDKPDSMSIRVTVEKPLVVASNGRLRAVVDNEDGTNTYDWFVSTPISNYCVTINIAPYERLDTAFTSVTGESFPFSFWVLPEALELGEKHLPHFVDNMKFLEQLLGPYPFRADKYGVAHTHYFGMENQSIIAYGSDFSLNEYGFDYLHFHELTHEWFANLVTAADWRDWWIHEGITSYIESLYAEFLAGGDEEVYLSYVRYRYFPQIENSMPIMISSHRSVSAREGYHGDVYVKAAAMLHTLRFVIGKDNMLELLEKMAYPTPESRKATDGSQCRFSSTREFKELLADVYGDPLDWFFDAYLYNAELPKLVMKKLKNKIKLSWETKSTGKFPLGVPVKIGSETTLVKMKKGRGKLKTTGREFEIDPKSWILKELVQE